ncbi:MAG: hypothetical protein ABIF09_07710 [Gemmatimonadota bacterium]
MKKVALGLFSVLFLSFIIAAQPGPDQAPTEDIVIQVSPQTILLGRDANSGNVWITIHAEILYSKAYEAVSVEIKNSVATILGNFDATSTFADNRGELVAKFIYDDIAGILGPGPAILTLVVKNGDIISSGSDDVRVVQR